MPEFDLRVSRQGKHYVLYDKGGRTLPKKLNNYGVMKGNRLVIANSKLIHLMRILPVRIFRQLVDKKYSMYKYPKPKFRDMCDASKGNKLTQLSPQQQFARAYVRPEGPFKGLLLWHAAGTGKTCSAVGVASTFMGQVNSSWNILWVTRQSLLHAPIKSMFGTVCLSQLRTAIKQKKISMKYAQNPNHWPLLQRTYAKQLPKYRIIRYSKFVDVCRRATSPDDVVRILKGEKLHRREKVKDPLRKTLIIIDEAHNLYNTTDFTDEYDDRVLHRQRGIDAVEKAIYRSYQQSGSKSCRLLLLTATPMTKSPTDLFRLVNLMIPVPERRLSLDLSRYVDAKGKISKKGMLKYSRKSLGLVSYFNGDRDPGFFAMKRWGYLMDAEVSELQVQEIQKCEKIADAAKRVECIRQRSNIASLRGKGYNFSFDSKQWNPEKLRKEMKIYAPKIHKMIQLIRALDKQDIKTKGKLFKHVIYTDVTSMGYGSKAVASALKAYGYERAWKFKGYRNSTVLEPPRLSTEKGSRQAKYRKSFAVLSKTAIAAVEGGSDNKQMASQGRTVATLNLFNERNNNHGKRVRFMVLDSTFKEGIDLMDVKYVHILEPPLNQSSYKQAIARAARRCGSRGLPYRKNRGWQVRIFMYRSVYPSDPSDPSGPKGSGEREKRKSVYELEMESVEGAETMRLMDQFEQLAIKSSVDYNLNKAILNFEPYKGFPDAVKIGKKIIG